MDIFALLQKIQNQNDTPAAPGVDPRIMREVSECYVLLSPENLFCDGESTREEAEKRRVRIHTRLKELFREAGQEIGEYEALRWRRQNVR